MSKYSGTYCKEYDSYYVAVEYEYYWDNGTWEQPPEDELTIKKVLVDGIPDNVLLNVNVPNSDLSEIRDMVVTRQDRGLYSAQAIKREDRYERTYYWIGGVRSTDDHGDDTDIHAVQNNRVSITPIKVDLTDYQQTESVKNWLSS